MKFHYVASNQQGTLTEGNQDASSTAELLALLASRGLKPVSVKPLKGSEAITYSKKFLGRSININDKIFLTKYLSIMLKVGIDLFQAINILLADFEKSTLRALLAEIRDNLERGQPFYATFAHYPQFFSPVFVNLVKSGETSGNLDNVFNDLTVSLSKEKELRSKIRGALVYPTLLFGMSIVILLFLTTFALPKLANVFTGGGFEAPLFSRVVFSIGLFINEYIWVILGIGALIVIFIWLFSRSKAGRAFFANIALHTPVVKKVTYNLAIQRFASTLSSLLRAGVPIIEALRITADTVGHPGIRASILRVANDGVAKGLTLGEAFRRETIFPFVVTNLVAISEKAGHLDEILDTVGKFYDAEIDASLKNAVAFIEPVLLLFIGVIIGTIALSVIVPVYQLVGQL
jgi:type IV pilus assembly protein PilC